jgi:peptide subunit release factor 1 (eRF1)
MATALTKDTLRDLARFRAANGCALSIYLDLDPTTTATIPAAETKFNATLTEAEKTAEAVADGRDCRLALRADLERIRAWWNHEFDRESVRSVAIFASSADGLFRALPLAGACRDSTHIGPSLHLAPLLDQVQAEGGLVAFVSRERGTIYRFDDGCLREVADETEEQPGQHDQGGWSQARYQRHIEHLVQQHLKTVGEAIEGRLRRDRLRIAMVVPEEMRGDLEAALSHEAREAVVGWTTAEAHAGPAQLVELVRPLFDEARARDDAELIERFESLHGRGEKSAAGWSQVLDAASDGRVEHLLVEEGARARGWECPRCGRASADGGACPLDGTKLEERDDAVDLAVGRTLAQGGSVVRFGSGALRDAKGIAALLRF